MRNILNKELKVVIIENKQQYLQQQQLQDFSSSNFVLRIKSIFSPTSLVDGLSINLGDIPFLEIRKLIFFNNVIFFIHNIKRTINPGADRGVGSPQPIQTILGLTLNYHVFLNTIAFRNIYPNQLYTSHTLHVLLAQTGLTVRF